MLADEQVRELSSVARGERGLSGAFFTSDTMFRHEVDYLLHGGWACIGASDDAGAPGSIYPVRIGGQDLLMARDRDGTLRVFYNHCSHRGALLTERPRRNCARIVCPYHSWTYDLSGALRKMPHVGGFGAHEAKGLDPATLGLHEIPMREWAGLVFVNLSGQAQDFDAFIAPMAARLGAYELGNLHLGGEAQVTAAANWKIVVENFVESYHLPWVHPTMNRYNPMEDHYQILGGSTYFGQGLLNLKWEDEAANVLPRFPNLKPEQLTTGESHFLFPNLLFGVMIDFAFAIVLFPEGPAQTSERALVLVNGREAAVDPALASVRGNLLDRVVSVNNEDIGVTESVQRGRASGAFRGGCFSPLQERTSKQLQQAYAIRMLAAGGFDVPEVVLELGEIRHGQDAIG